MLKCRIRTVFSPFFSSIIGRRDAASLKLSVALLNSFQFKVEDLRQTVHNSAFEDDDDSFSELGQQFEPRRKGFLKPMTEKTSNITKHNHRSKNKSAPSKVVKDYGESESADSGGQPAIYAARIKVESSNLLIHPCPADELFTVRINGICTKTSDYTVCAVCGSFCILLGIKRTGKTSVDAVFRVKDQRKRNKLLKRLSVIKDGCQWAAHEERLGLSSPAQKKNQQSGDLAIDIKSQLTDMRDEIIWKKLLCDDLINLHRSIMYLEGQHKDLPEADGE